MKRYQIGMKKKYWLLLSFCVFWLMSAKSQQAEVDSLLLDYKTATHDTTRIITLNNLAGFYFELHPDSSLYYAKEAFAIAEKNAYLQRQAQMLQTIGVAFDYKGNLDSCLFYLGKSLEKYKNLKLPEKQSHVIADIALAWYFRGNYELAIRNQLAALELRKQAGNKKYISNSLNNLGLAYKARKDYPTAINYYKQSLTIKEETGDNLGIMNTTMNIGSLYQSRLIYDSAYLFAEKGLQIAIKLNSTKDIAGCKGNMGDALLNMNRIPEAKKYLAEAENIALVLNYTTCLITVYHAMGNIMVKEGNLTEALVYFQKGLQMSASNNRQEPVLNFTEKLAETYRAMGLPDKALFFKDSSIAVSNRLLNAENLRQINEMTAVYKTNEKEKQIIVLNAENNVVTSLAGRRKKERNYFIAASALFIALAGFAFKAYRDNRKKKDELNRKNLIIEKTLSEKEVLMKEIHHRVKNNLQIVSSLLSLQSNYIKDEQALDAVTDSKNRVQSMALIHQNLYQENNLTGINVKDYIGKLCDNLFSTYNIRPGKIKLIKEIDNLIMDVDMVVPVGLILNELITNCLKYGFGNNFVDGMIKIILNEKDGSLHLAVYDNGKGFPPGFSEKGGQSFGYIMIEAFMGKLEGKVKYYNDEGARAEIEIPNFRK